MVLRIAEQIVHHYGICHRRKYRAQAIFAVEPLRYPRDGSIDRTLAHALRKKRFSPVQHVINSSEKPKPRRILMRCSGDRSSSLKRLKKELFDVNMFGVAACRLERLQYGQWDDST